MGATSEDLKHDIEHKREELGDHVAALGDHVTPGRMAQRRWQGVRSSVLGTSNDDTTDTENSKPRSVPAIAASAFVSGLILGIWLTRRRYRATLRQVRADA